MRVAMYYSNRDVRSERLPKPRIGAGELLVKVMASGICGSDVLEWYRAKKAPLVLGHEITGEIVERGRGVEKYKVGDRVFVLHHVPCNSCRYCINGHHTVCKTLQNTNYFPGGLSEYIRVPELNVERGVFMLPDEVSFEEGTLIEPLACAVHGQRAAALKPGQCVFILGSGVSGLLHLLLARDLKAGPIIVADINECRLKAALRFGADFALQVDGDIPVRLKKVNGNRPADIVIVCTGAFNAFTQALRCVDDGGTVLFFAATAPGRDIPVPVNKFWRSEIKLMTSYGSSPDDAAFAIELIRTGRIRVRDMITHRLNIDQAGLGFRLVTEAADSLKVIIEPHRP